MLADVTLSPKGVILHPRSRTGIIGTAEPITSSPCCLIVAHGPERRHMLTEAASDAGWETRECVEPCGAAESLVDENVQLSLIDLQDRSRAETQDLQRLAECLARRPNHLLMICGNQGDPLEELWARQLGAWLYLPGVDSRADVETLCGEARTVTERRPPQRTATKRVNAN